ncbi:hypothetical protein ACIQFU_12105 [Streptomyces sp. NPDC093065]|uniref:hypothetical protein n=1 Tax=unclassified Streptomyces TaxID=2593676 RepID=UPI002075102A|nr:hypothetical protein [Streptomyces sp. STCH 565 A]MCM8556155.1 hypothetical protein [Streptomyces sp. STCH 565 A]
MSGTVRVDYHTFELTDSQQSAPMGFTPQNGLVFSQPGQAAICTGISMGWVNVSVQARRHPPSHVDADDWEEVVDHTVTTTTGTLRVTSTMDDAPDLPPLTEHGPGTYRLRVHARGRDTDPDGAPEDAVEDYLLVAWPAEAQPDQIHKRTDHYGAELRAAPSVPAPPQPAVTAEHAADQRLFERLNRRRDK